MLGVPQDLRLRPQVGVDSTLRFPGQTFVYSKHWLTPRQGSFLLINSQAITYSVCTALSIRRCSAERGH